MAGRRASGAVAHVDLLRALVLAGGEDAAARRWAGQLGFAREVEVAAPALAPASVRVEASPSAVRAADRLDAGAGAVREPLRARHWAITRCERLPTDDVTPEPGLPQAPLTLADCLPRQRTGAAPYLPLVRAAALWPALRHSLARRRLGGADMHRLGRQLAVGRVPTRMPRLHRVGWHAELLVLRDRADPLGCYQGDYDQLLARLRALRGKAGLQVRDVYAVPGQVLPGRDGRVRPLPAAVPGQQVLVLSDLGALAPGGEAAAQWQHHLRRLARAGAHAVAWVPHARRQVDVATAALAGVHCLHPGIGLRRQWGRVHDAAQRQREAERLAALRDTLLLMTACCLRVEPALLRALRAAHPATAQEPGLEALVWGHQPVVGSSLLSRPLCAQVQGGYRQRFGLELTVAQQRAAFQQAYRWHAWQGRSTQEGEALVWRAHASPTAQAGFEPEALSDAQRWFESLGANLAGAGSMVADFSGFSADFVQRNAGDARFMAAGAANLPALWACSGLAQLPAGLDAGKALRARERLHGRKGPVARRLTLWQVTGGWQLLADGATPAGPGCSRLGMPVVATGVVWADALGRALHVAADDEVSLPALVGVQATLVAGGLRQTLTLNDRPAWAKEFGRDRQGLYADLEVRGVTQRMRWIEPGEFLMGSPPDEPQRYGNEGPQHPVLITEGCWLADSACTQAFWLAVMSGRNPSMFREQAGGGLLHPVEQVSWEDAQRFLERLQAEAGRGVLPALPTEAEWEFACRAGTTTPFSPGTTINTDQVNFNGNHPYADGPKGEYRERTLPVKSLPGNPWGLYEMHGNVYEWCADGLRDYAAEAVVDPGRGDGVVTRRALRGGSWFREAWDTRSAFRDAYEPGLRNGLVGFRFALRATSHVSASAPEGPVSSPGDQTPAREATDQLGWPQAGKKRWWSLLKWPRKTP